MRTRNLTTPRLPRASAKIAADRFHLGELFHQFVDVRSLTFVHPIRTNQVLELLLSRLQENGFKVANFALPATSDIAPNL
jgi:hypothetical protein